MFDLKTLNSALAQLEEERGISREKILAAIEDAMVAAYKKDYGKRGQIIRAKFDLATGDVQFSQIKIAVDDSMIRPDDDEAPTPESAGQEKMEEAVDENGDPAKVRFNEDHHIWLPDARRIKKDVVPGEELIFPLETKADYGRIAAQTAKQVVTQRLREAEKSSILEEYKQKEGEILSGRVQKIERGNVLIDLGRTTGLLPQEEQISGEFYRQGERVKCYLYAVEEGPRGISIRLSRSHPKFVERLFELEAPEIANGTVEIKAAAREAGSRTKIAVATTNPNIDPVGACVGQRGTRVNTVINELGGEKIDIIEWSEDTESFIQNALSPAKINKVTLFSEENRTEVEVEPDQFSLAVGKGGQNVRLAAKLTGWKIDIVSTEGETTSPSDEAEEGVEKTEEAS